jgi:hypothetical protein
VPEIDELADLRDDCRHLPTAMLPRPRTAEPKVIDLTAMDVAIPATAAALVEGYGEYGS